MRKLRYYKRHRMELDLQHPRPPAELPPGYFWVPWSGQLLDIHAQVLCACFAGETDAEVFPCLATLQGCRDLMTAITNRPGFCPSATWLVANKDCSLGSVQGLCEETGYGGVQNLGVVAGFRGAGIGRALLLKTLAGFETAGLKRVFLEVTATNTTAVRMYRRIGFRAVKTIYREVEVKPAVPDHVGVGI